MLDLKAMRRLLLLCVPLLSWGMDFMTIFIKLVKLISVLREHASIIALTRMSFVVFRKRRESDVITKF